MKASKRHRFAPFAGVASLAVCAATSALAQTDSDTTASLEEVVVTATRRAEDVNRVPLAITAQTQRALDQQGIQTIRDLQATVPGLRLTGQEASGVATISIRGVRQTSATAATTGFYLDETSLQKRAAAGFGSVNGTPVPPLFDLQRVEVLRGPQGTLFGGGSEGGTIRYIQPQPSLDSFSTYARAQVMGTKNGDLSYEAGVAIGGPIVQDKLGFRASLFGRKTGGYVDLVDYRTGAIYDKNSNEGTASTARLAVTWAPSENSRITASFFRSKDSTDNVNSATNLPIPGALQAPSLCFDTNAIQAMPVGSPGRVLPSAFAGGPGCNGRAGQPGVVVTPGFTVGPLNLGRFQSLALGPTPTSTRLEVSSLDGQWSVTDWLTLRSVTSYVDDLGTGMSPQNFHQTFLSYAPAGGARYTAPGEAPLTIAAGIGFNPNITASPNGLGLGAYFETNTNNRRRAFTQEFRLSTSTDKAVSVVAGAYYANIRTKVSQRADTLDQGWIQMTGLSILQRFGVPNPGYFAQIYENDQDKELAGFGEVTVKLGEHLRTTGGLRVTRVKTAFVQSNYGPNSFNVQPSVATGTLVIGSITETPVTPKVSVQYLITPDDILYATAAKGFRAGGVNQVFSSAGQGQLFGQYGLTKAILPVTYGSDTVWSYELGAKLRFWRNRAQLNAALYRIDWKDVQTNVGIGGDGFVANVPSARSKGAEVELQLRPFEALTLNAAAAYGKAKYTSTLKYAGARGLDLFAAQNGQLFPQPKWTLDFGARYDVALPGANRGYLRLDYRWLDGYALAPPGSPGYTPDSSLVPKQGNLNLRLGVEHADFDLNLFVNNLTDEKKGQTTGGRSSCTNADCSTFLTYNIARTLSAPIPRQIGVQLVYRH
jgi:outer membrane receptor protein involved in Fe transport